MVAILPFRAVRPRKDVALEMSAPPYDVVNSEEARELVRGCEKSYLRISRPEVDLALDVDEHDDAVYEKGRDNFNLFKQKGWLKQDSTPSYYIYRQGMGNHTQVGIVAVASVDDYDQDRIRKHEFTRPDKEDDRTRHVETIGANTEPVFFTYRASPEIDSVVAQWMKTHEPAYDFASDDQVKHTLWVCDDSAVVSRMRDAFSAISVMYVADGHHRSAAASRVRKLRQDRNLGHKGSEEYNAFLTVVFPDNQMNIMAYNRVVQDLNGLDKNGFLEKVSRSFEVIPNGSDVPSGQREFSMYLDKSWYTLKPRDGSFAADDPVARLDASILQNNLLHPVLGIDNPRTNKRISFVGGIRGTAELIKLVDSGRYSVAFSLSPVSISDLISVADSGQVMPPKSTWFEPKLRSGLFIHELD